MLLQPPSGTFVQPVRDEPIFPWRASITRTRIAATTAMQPEIAGVSARQDDNPVPRSAGGAASSRIPAAAQDVPPAIASTARLTRLQADHGQFTFLAIQGLSRLKLH